MYCEKCKRVIEGERCPVCRRSVVRPVAPDDLCFLTEQDYLSSGILEDVLKQREIPFLKKEVMGAGLAIKVGPMLDRSRFYVLYSQWENALSIVDELFSVSQEENGSGQEEQTGQDSI